MSRRAAVIARHGSPIGEAAAAALATRGWTVVAIPAGRGPLGLALALARAARARADAVVTISAPDGAHLVGRLLARRARWVAHVEDPLALRSDRWGRILDPRARALRRADAVTASAGQLGPMHRASGAAVWHEPAGAAELARAVEPAVAGGGLRLLLLGTLNTPHVEHMATAMRDRGLRVTVAGEVTPAYPPSVLPAAGIAVHPLEIPAVPWLWRLARRVRPDVVHANWLPSYGFLAALLRLRPLVAMAWGSDVYNAAPSQVRRARFAARRADVGMSDSQDLVDRVVELGADPGATFLLNWGVDLEAFAPAADRAAVRRELGLGDGPVVLSPRALRPLYNPRVIVDAFDDVAAQAPDARLLLKHIGTDVPDLGRPLPAAAQIVGHVPYEQLAEYYRAADVCVSIPDSDSSPRSVWEAMACGCACVVSDLPWAHELIVDGEHALVVPAERAAVADALRRLLTEPGLAVRLGANARALVERERDQRVEMDRLAALYERMARPASPR